MRMLVIHMIKSGESLEWVVDQLIQGKKIKNIHQQAKQMAAEEFKLRKSTTGRPTSPLRSPSTLGLPVISRQSTASV